MYTILILCLLAVASAAPHYGYHHHGHFHGHHGELRDHSEESREGNHGEEFHGPGFRRPHPPYQGFGQEVFDTRAFWAQLADELKQMDDMLKHFYDHFPSSVSSEGVDGNEYKIVIPLNGYKEEDISVKARTGVLMIQAVQTTDEGHQRSYIDVRTLPECIDLSGTWNYNDNVLTIQFPVKKSDDVTVTPVTDAVAEFTTEAPEHSREEMGHDDNGNLDVDIGNRGDNDQDKEIITNEITGSQAVEATTYAVDLKNEVEFVPVKYY